MGIEVHQQPTKETILQLCLLTLPHSALQYPLALHPFVCSTKQDNATTITHIPYIITTHYHTTKKLYASATGAASPSFSTFFIFSSNFFLLTSAFSCSLTSCLLFQAPLYSSKKSALSSLTLPPLSPITTSFILKKGQSLPSP